MRTLGDLRRAVANLGHLPDKTLLFVETEPGRVRPTHIIYEDEAMAGADPILIISPDSEGTERGTVQ